MAESEFFGVIKCCKEIASGVC
uniref:Uncharacterized protein n=1 Tax=Rhizophora mucronata TaxID=61149 RepID=A0A2P2Q8R0_RHIMU